MTYTRDVPTTTKSPKKRRWHRPSGRQLMTWFAIVVLLVFITGAIVHVLGGDNPLAPAPAGPPDAAQGQDGMAPPPKATTTFPAGTPSCGSFPAPDAGAAPDLLSPPFATWALVGGMATPGDPATGPAFTTPTRYCYAPTPAGALFAATNYLAQMQAPDQTPAGEIALATRSMADTPARAKFLNQWAAPTTQPAAAGGGQVDTRPAFDAFHFIAYTPELAIIDLASSWSGHLDAATYTMRFAGADWLIDPPDTGHFPMRQLPVEDSSYWVHWAAT